MEWQLADVIDMPSGVGRSNSRGVLESARLIVQLVSAAMECFVLGRGLLVVDLACLL